MSHLTNTDYLERSEELFADAVEQGNYSHAQSIIQNLRDHGFDASADYLADVLLHFPVSTFAIISPFYQ